MTETQSLQTFPAPLPPDYWEDMSPSDLSAWARQASPEQAEQSQTVVVFGYNLPGVHSRWMGIDCKLPGTENRKTKIKLWTLHYILDGQGTIIPTNNPSTSHEVRPGMIAWSTPEAQTIFRVTGDKPLRAFVVRMFGDEMSERFSKAFSSTIGCRRVNKPGIIESSFAELFLEAQLRNIHRDTNCAHLTEVLLNRITTHLELSDSFAGEARLYYQQAQTFLDTNYATIRNSIEVAKHCGLTRQYLGRVFKAFSGVSPHQYLSNLRMYHARELLIATNLSIRDVGIKVGYEDAGLFTRNFRKVEGESPRAFRNRFRE